MTKAEIVKKLGLINKLKTELKNRGSSDLEVRILILEKEIDTLKAVIDLKDVETESTSDFTLDAVFVAICHDPNVKFFDGHVELDEKGYIKTGFTTETSTSVPGVFAAGDVADSLYRQAITAAGTGCQAAMDVERWLDH